MMTMPIGAPRRTLPGTTILFGAVMVLAAWSGTARAGDSVLWRKDYNSARREAAEKGKPLFIDFGTEDCFHCRRLDGSTFKNADVVQLLNENFIPLKVDANREPVLTNALRIQAYPTLIIAGSDGKILGTIEGYMEAARLSEHLQRGLAVVTPDGLARDYNEASKAISANDYARAIALLKSIGEDGKDRPVQVKARQLLVDLELQASQKAIRVKDLLDRGQSQQAMEVLTDVVRKYPGTKAAEQSAKQIALLTEKPAVREHAREQRAGELIAAAREEYRRERYHRCVENCQTILTSFGQSPEAKEAGDLLKDINGSPERLAKAVDAMAEQTSEMYARLADSWKQKGRPEEAALCYEKVIKLTPASPLAYSAQTELASLKRATPTVPVQYQKP